MNRLKIAQDLLKIARTLTAEEIGARKFRTIVMRKLKDKLPSDWEFGRVPAWNGKVFSVEREDGIKKVLDLQTSRMGSFVYLRLYTIKGDKIMVHETREVIPQVTPRTEEGLKTIFKAINSFNWSK